MFFRPVNNAATQGRQCALAHIVLPDVWKTVRPLPTRLIISRQPPPLTAETARMSAGGSGVQDNCSGKNRASWRGLNTVLPKVRLRISERLFAADHPPIHDVARALLGQARLVGFGRSWSIAQERFAQGVGGGLAERRSGMRAVASSLNSDDHRLPASK